MHYFPLIFLWRLLGSAPENPREFFAALANNTQSAATSEQEITTPEEIVKHLSQWDANKFTIVQHESEWHDKAESKSIFDTLLQMFQERDLELPFKLEHEKQRVNQLIWMQDVGIGKHVWSWWPVLKQTSWIFPLSFVPSESYKVSPRSFGSARSGGRKHAGCDLYAPVGTNIYAMKDGIVKNIYAFYLGTKAIEVDHGDVLIRYGEISEIIDDICVGRKVIAGDPIAKVGQLKFESGTIMSMLHIEFYNKTATGNLTDRNNLPYKRREDLIDPTPFLDKAILRS